MSPSASYQQGFLIPAALIVIVGLAALALSISRLSSQAGNSSFREAISAQTFYAAESGVQLGMSRIFFPSAVRTTADTNCGLLNGTTIPFNVAGLQGCSTTINCQLNTNAANSVSFYTVSSSANCGAGDIRSERIIQAMASIRGVAP